MTTLLVDSSVVIKWFHELDEPDAASARQILSAAISDVVTCCVIDLATYELGNVLLRKLGWSASQFVSQLDDLAVICGPPIVPDLAIIRRAAVLATTHNLTFYDAVLAASSAELGAALVTVDAQLIAQRLGEAPRSIVTRLGLTSS